MIMVIIAFHVSYMTFGIMMMTHLDSHNRKYIDFNVSNNQSNCRLQPCIVLQRQLSVYNIV